MPFPENNPPLSKLPFIVGDSLLLLTAIFIASRSASPLGAAPLLGIAFCVGLGAVIALIPFLLDYTRRQDAELEMREQNLDRLKRDVLAAADQVGTSLNTLSGLNEQSVTAHERALELPAALDAKIQAIKKMLSAELDAHQQGLARKIEALHSSETDKWTHIASEVARSVAELSAAAMRIEPLSQQLDAASRSLQAAIESANAASREAAALTTKPSSTKSPKNTKITEPTPSQTSEASASSAKEDSPPETSENRHDSPKPATEEPQAGDTAPVEEPPPAPDVEAAEPETSLPAVAEDASSASTTPPTPDPEPTPKPAPAHRKKHTAAKDAGPDLFGETSADEIAPAPAPIITPATDGATRLIVTAYIGIGNKLYVRGDGPGLHPDKGVPLQFVSIGKWRWETDRADHPLKIRLYKNDEVECTELGEIELEPKHQVEVSANF